MELNFINKRFPFLKNIAIISIILINVLVVSFVDDCNDYYNVSLLNKTSDNIEDEAINSQQTQISWWKAGISEYTTNAGFQEIEPVVSAAETSVMTTTETLPETTITSETEKSESTTDFV